MTDLKVIQRPYLNVKFSGFSKSGVKNGGNRGQKALSEPLLIVLQKLTPMENSIRKINEENRRRAQEIAILAKYNN